MSITISIHSSESGKPQPKPGMAGALGATEPEGSLDNSVEITIDEGHRVEDIEQALDAAALAAAKAFSVTFQPEGVIEYVGEETGTDQSDDAVEEPHVCGSECRMGVEIIEASDPEGLAEALVESIRRARRDLRNGRGA